MRRDEQSDKRKGLYFSLMLLLISLCFFFYADMENGYIKNIAGQMPMKGFTVLSKFIAAGVHNIIFAAAGIIGNLIGTLLVWPIIMDVSVPELFRVLFLRLLLVHSICATLLQVVTTFRSKAFGMVLAVLYGLGLTGLIYAGIGLEEIYLRTMTLEEYYLGMTGGSHNG